MTKIDHMVRCVVCNEHEKEGIKILEHFICNPCEMEILKTDVNDERYAHFVVQLKSLLCEPRV